MKKNFFYKKTINGENKKTFIFGIPFSYKKKTTDGYIDRRLFGLWKVKKKDWEKTYYFCAIPFLKKSFIKNRLQNLEKSFQNLAEKQLLMSQHLASAQQILRDFSVQQNKNMINIFLQQKNDTDLFILQNDHILFVFSKEIYLHDTFFIYNYFIRNDSIDKLYNFRILPETCDLYKEHIDAFKNKNVLLYKYSDRIGIIKKTTITYENDDLFIEEKFLGIENYEVDNGRKYTDIPKRKIISGITLMDYLKNETDEQQKRILKNFFDWLFATYQHPTEKDKLDGKLIDCNLGNVLVSEGKFHLIDQEFSVEYGISKDFCVWYALGIRCISSPYYEYFTELYGLNKISPDEPHPFWLENNGMKKAYALNQNLFNKYFTEAFLIPERN